MVRFKWLDCRGHACTLDCCGRSDVLASLRVVSYFLLFFFSLALRRETLGVRTKATLRTDLLHTSTRTNAIWRDWCMSHTSWRRSLCFWFWALSGLCLCFRSWGGGALQPLYWYNFSFVFFGEGPSIIKPHSAVNMRLDCWRHACTKKIAFCAFCMFSTASLPLCPSFHLGTPGDKGWQAGAKSWCILYCVQYS